MAAGVHRVDHMADKLYECLPIHRLAALAEAQWRAVSVDHVQQRANGRGEMPVGLVGAYLFWKKQMKTF